MSSAAQRAQVAHLARQHRLNVNNRGRNIPTRQPRLKFIDPEIIFIRFTIKIVCAYFGYEPYVILNSRNRKMVQIKFLIYFITYHIRSIPAPKICKYCKQHSGSNIVYGVERMKIKLGMGENRDNWSKHLQNVRARLAI